MSALQTSFNRHQEEVRLIQMIETDQIHDMTLQEICSALKTHNERLVHAHTWVNHARRRLLCYDVRRQEAQNYLDQGRGTPAQQRKWRQIIEAGQHAEQWYAESLPREEQRLATLQQRIAMLEATKAAKAAATAAAPVDVPAAAAPDAVDVPAAAAPDHVDFHVQLLNGEIRTVVIDRRQPVSGFADHFAAAHGYRQTHRFVFLLPPQKPYEDEADEADEADKEEEKETVFWSHDHRHSGQTYQDLIGQATLVRLLLLIQPLQDPEWAAKMELIRKILTAEKRYIPSSEDILGLYGEWILTQGEYANRYLRLKAFVQAYPDVFYSVSDDQFQHVKQASEVDAFRTWYLDLERVRASEFGQRHRPNVLRNIQRFLERFQERFNDRPAPLHNQVIDFYLSSLTRDELLATGIRPAHFRPGKIQSYLADWDDWIARAFPQ